MALIKIRPNIRLLLQRPLVAGALAEFIVQLECPAALPVDAVSLTLIGEVLWFTSSQHGRHRNASRFLSLDVPLVDNETTLDAGTHELRTRVNLGRDLPGSWTGDRLGVEYRVKVHVDIPWWPDKRVDFIVPVASSPVQLPAAAESGPPTVFVSRAGGPPPRGPYLELSLDRRSTAPGSSLRASAALGNVERNRYRKLHVSFIAQESFPIGLGGGLYVGDHVVSRWSVDIEGHPDELQPIPFTLSVPSSIAPAFALHGCELRWLIQVQADVAWGSDPTLRVPIEVSPREAEHEERRSVPLAVGSDRLRLIWSKVAQTSALQFEDDRLTGAIDEVAIELYRAQVDERTCVVARLAFPALGVDLRLARERRGLLGQTSAVLGARDRGQEQALRALLDDGGLDEAHTPQLELLDATDTRLEFGSQTTGLELAPLLALARRIVALARALHELARTLPPPAPLLAHAGNWTRAAQRLAATQRAGDLRLEIERGELRVRVGSSFNTDGELRGVTLSVDPGLPIPSRLHLAWTPDEALPETRPELGSLEPLVAPPAWMSELEREPSLALNITAQRVSVFIPALLCDPELERDRIEALFGVGRRLRGEQGPYR